MSTKLCRLQDGKKMHLLGDFRDSASPQGLLRSIFCRMSYTFQLANLLLQIMAPPPKTNMTLFMGKNGRCS